MPKNTYKAIFSDGDEKTRTTARTYTHAWRVSANGFADYGFAGSEKLASTAAFSLATHKYGSKVEIVSCEVQS